MQDCRIVPFRGLCAASLHLCILSAEWWHIDKKLKQVVVLVAGEASFIWETSSSLGNTGISQLMSHTKAKWWAGQLAAPSRRLSGGVMHHRFSLLHQTSSPSFCLVLTELRTGKGRLNDKLADLSNWRRPSVKDWQLARQRDRRTGCFWQTLNCRVQRNASRDAAWLREE